MKIALGVDNLPQGDLVLQVILPSGSQGHGFMERIALGSTSLEQAIKLPYSVLVVRA